MRNEIEGTKVHSMWDVGCAMYWRAERTSDQRCFAALSMTAKGAQDDGARRHWEIKENEHAELDHGVVGGGITLWHGWM